MRSDDPVPEGEQRDESVEQDGSRAASALIVNGASFSGLERNRFFLNRGGSEFLNLSGVSGLDDPADTRTHVYFDFDGDGWLDIAHVNANAPLLQLFRNKIGDLGVPGHFLALRFVGGNGAAVPAPGSSSRDAYGAKVWLTMGDGFKIVREHRAGDGFAAQNSATLIVGIGDRSCVRSLRVRWPSGQVQELRDLPADHLVTLSEPGGDASSEESASIRPYVAVDGPPTVPGRPRCAVSSSER